MNIDKLRSRKILLAGAIAPLAGLLLVQAIKLLRGKPLGRGIAWASSGFRHLPAGTVTRVLVMGDSAGLGAGAQHGRSIAALLAADRSDVEVLNVSRSGARLADIATQLKLLPTGSKQLAKRWDVLLLHAGGSDILRGASPVSMQRETDTLLAELTTLARQVVWLGPANTGLLPTLVPPFSWLLSRRSVHACALFQRCAERAGVHFVNFCKPPKDDVLSADPRTGNTRRRSLAAMATNY